MRKKTGLFKKFLSVVLAGITLCSTNLVCSKTHAETSPEKAGVVVGAVAAGLSALTAIIGGVAAIITTVHTGDLSRKIQKSEVELPILALEILDLISDISDLEEDIEAGPPPSELKRKKEELKKLQTKLQMKNEELKKLQIELQMNNIELSNLRRAYRYHRDIVLPNHVYVPHIHTHIHT